MGIINWNFNVRYLKCHIEKTGPYIYGKKSLKCAKDNRFKMCSVLDSSLKKSVSES